MKKTVVVLGGGISGLTAAYTLSKKGFDVVLLEKKDSVGGLAGTFSYKNHLIDYGPHNFHTHLDGVLSFVKDELGVPMRPIPITSSKLFFMGKFVNYPLKIHDAIRNMNIGVSAKCFMDYAFSRLRLKLEPDKKMDSFESWVKSRFGGYIYDLYFGPYVKKVWGIPGHDLDVVVAKRRIPEPSLFSLIARAISGMRWGERHSEDPESVKSYYPPKGIGMIADRLQHLIKSNNGRIELDCRIESIVSDKERAGGKEIIYSSGGVRKSVKWDYIISSIPVYDLFTALGTPAGNDISSHVSALPYRSIVLLYMFLSVEKIFDVPWVYFNEKDNPELIFNRMYEVGNFSEEMVHNKQGIMCLEITCYKGDDLWNKPDSALFDTCIAYLEKRGFLKRAGVKEILTKRIEVAYPIFKKGYHMHLNEIVRFLIDRGDIFPIGRQGLFSYANVDHCIDMGLKTGRLLSEGASPKDFYKIYKEYLF